LQNDLNILCTYEIDGGCWMMSPSARRQVLTGKWCSCQCSNMPKCLLWNVVNALLFADGYIWELKRNVTINIWTGRNCYVKRGSAIWSKPNRYQIL